MLTSLKTKRPEVRNKTGISIRRNGNLIVTDFWDSLRRSEALSLELRTENDFSDEFCIGVVDSGLLHGEEPWIEGSLGTAAVYVHGCALKCKTCYQPEFFAKSARRYTSVRSLVDFMISAERRASTISFILDDYNEYIQAAIRLAREAGVRIPIVYKYSGAMRVSHIEKLLKDIDIFVPDCKGLSVELLELHGLPRSYALAAIEGIRYLISQSKPTIVRHLLVPEYNSKLLEVERIIDGLKLSNSNAVLSILTAYRDRRRNSYWQAPRELRHAIALIGQRKNCRIFMSDGDSHDR